ncbi:MAG: trypsin-like peptidase domain-containing protein [Gemmatimonadales bacterium]|nr:trypsin-like peptidase domain-containing protein [Gemmatimonadales bacterium]
MRSALALLALVAACGPRDTGGGPGADTLHAQARATRTDEVTAGRRTAIVTAARRVGPSVVSITVTSRQQVQVASPFDFFFMPQTREQLVQGSGTGFVLRGDGTVLTNQHVVNGAEKIVVTLPDGTDAPAELLGEDAVTDIAVIRVQAKGLQPAPIGRSTDLAIGEWVMALGNPYAYVLGNTEPSVTVGVISALNRNILPSRDQPGLYLDMLQTDAAINPGNSGGPLANADGEVIGVNSSILSNTGQSVGLGFAIPIERAVRVAEEIIRQGTVRRAWTGLDVEGPEGMGNWKTQGGVKVTAVAPGGPAARAGLSRGDVLVRAGGRRLRNYLDWEAVKLDLHVGDAVEVTSRGALGEATRRLVTGDLPSVAAEKVTVLRNLQLITVTPQVRQERGVQSDGGALIYRLPEETAGATGLRAGDVIVAVDNIRVRSAEEVGRTLEGMPRRRPFRLYFERQGQILFADLTF